jgi:elongation factor P
MYGITDLKKGTLIQLDGRPYRVVEYSQKVMGRGGSVVNVRLKSLLDGAVIPKTFKGSDRLEPAHVESRKVQYLYNDGQSYFFMDGQTFEQFELSAEAIEEIAPYLVEGYDEVDLQSFNGRIINAEIPNNLYLKVTRAENVVKGDTTSSVLKDVTLETGLVIKAPAFIKVGDEIKVDTRSGEYLERKK